MHCACSTCRTSSRAVRTTPPPCPSLSSTRSGKGLTRPRRCPPSPSSSSFWSLSSLSASLGRTWWNRAAPPVRGRNEHRNSPPGRTGQRPPRGAEQGEMGAGPHVHQCSRDPDLVSGARLLDGRRGVPRGRLHVRHVLLSHACHAG